MACKKGKWGGTSEVRDENGKMMCGVKLQDGVPSKELRGRLVLDDIISVLQQNRL